MITAIVDVTCPECGTTNAHKLNFDDRLHPQPIVVTCPIEGGGCDIDFVLDAWLSVRTRVLRIVAPEVDKNEAE